MGVEGGHIDAEQKPIVLLISMGAFLLSTETAQTSETYMESTGAAMVSSRTSKTAPTAGNSGVSTEASLI